MADELVICTEAGCGICRTRVQDTIRHVAKAKPYFTSDDVWAVFEREKWALPRERTLLGSAMRDSGFARPTQVHEKSRRRINHGRPVRVWRSVIHNEKRSAL